MSPSENGGGRTDTPDVSVRTPRGMRTRHCPGDHVGSVSGTSLGCTFATDPPEPSVGGGAGRRPTTRSGEPRSTQDFTSREGREENPFGDVPSEGLSPPVPTTDVPTP